MATSSEPKISLRLIIDDEKNKVVLAEAGKDFVEVLYRFLTLPMGTIVRLLENNHQKSDQPVSIGCLSNLYRSVVDMKIDDFETEACKEMLLYPRSIREAKCKLNINPIEMFKCFVCPSFYCCLMCSHFSTSLCVCGEAMTREISFLKDRGMMQNDLDGICYIKDTSSFIITDDLKLTVDSTSSLLKTLQELGCTDVTKLRERVLDISLKEVLILLQCVFSSNTPLTDTFLKNQSLHKVRKISRRLSPCFERKTDEVEQDKVITFDEIVRKQDMKIMYVECGEDFVNMLFTFLAIPLESTLKISASNVTLGCVGNLFRSLKDLSANSQVSDSKCVLPYYYGFRNQLMDIVATKPRVYLHYRHSLKLDYFERFRQEPRLATKRTSIIDDRMTVVDPKDGDGFVKRDTKFTVSDDLIVTPKKSSSTFSVLKKLQIRAEDLEVQEISIGKTEAVNLLRASLVTSSALSSAFRNLIVWKVPKEEERWNPNSKKPKTHI